MIEQIKMSELILKILYGYGIRTGTRTKRSLDQLIKLTLRIRTEAKESRHESRAEIQTFEDQDTF
jgi:hypothetical protein